MYVLLVYDTAADRNAPVLRTCRQYLHHVQRSVFEGHLSPAQLRRFRAALSSHLDPNYDEVIIYTFPPGTQPHRTTLGKATAGPTDIL